jgi:L-rhamnose mutarotase
MIKQTRWLVCLVAVAAENRVICPEDSSVFGYTTIDDMNQDMKKMIESGINQDFESYVYRLAHTLSLMEEIA